MGDILAILDKLKLGIVVGTGAIDCENDCNQACTYKKSGRAGMVACLDKQVDGAWKDAILNAIDGAL